LDRPAADELSGLPEDGTFVGKTRSSWLSVVRSVNKKTQNSRVLRANVFLPPPKVLLSGPPKSGTHLLSDCLSLMPKMMFSGRHFALTDFFIKDIGPSAARSDRPASPPLVDKARLRRYLERCPQGMFVTAHARFHQSFSELVKELHFKHVLLLRDPRDVAVSHSFYMLQDTLHQHHKYYARTLKSSEERLMASIRGFDEGEEVREFIPSIGETFGRYLPWLNDPSTLVVRFEDLVGPSRGGGDTKRQLDEILRIGEFVERPLNLERAQRIAKEMYGKGSLTFRKGHAGDWRNHFTQAHKDAFKEVAGDLLIRLDYEKDLKW
jgi:hypothetical protein